MKGEIFQVLRKHKKSIKKGQGGVTSIFLGQLFSLQLLAEFSPSSGDSWQHAVEKSGQYLE